MRAERAEAVAAAAQADTESAATLAAEAEGATDRGADTAPAACTDADAGPRADGNAVPRRRLRQARADSTPERQACAAPIPGWRDHALADGDAVWARQRRCWCPRRRPWDWDSRLTSHRRTRASRTAAASRAEANACEATTDDAAAAMHAAAGCVG